MPYEKNKYSSHQVPNAMVRELKDVRYEAQLKKNLISVGALEA